MSQTNNLSQKFIRYRHLLFDFNGTLAVDGFLIPHVKELLIELSNKFSIHIITADTFGRVHEEMQDINCTIKIIHPEHEQQQKLDYLNSLNAEETVSIGNGCNDELMLKHAALGILVIGPEGAAGACFKHAHIVCNNIIDALHLLSNPLRIIATLRK